MTAGPSPAGRDNRSIPNNTPVNQLAHKIAQNGHLSITDKTELQALAEKRSPLKERITSHFGEVAKINALSAAILSRKEPLSSAKEKIAQTLAHNPQEEKALAGLLLSYESARQRPFLLEECNRLIDKGVTLDRAVLQRLVDKHNTLSLPIPEKAGALFFETPDCKIYCNQTGELFLAGPDKKIAEPIVLEKCNQHLSAEKIALMEQTYNELTDHTPYQNAGPMLEFIRFFRECREVNPTLSLEEAYNSCQLDPANIYEKYRGGDCVILAGALQKRLRSQGFEVGIGGQCTGAAWANPPLPYSDPSLSWLEYDQKTEDVHHCVCIARYSNLDGQEEGMYFDFFATVQSPILQASWQEIEQEAASSRKDTRGQIVNIEHILKMQMSGKTKIVLASRVNNKASLGIDFLKGNLYLNPTALGCFRDLPLNQQDQLSIPLTDLQSPDALGTYWVNGQAEQMTHRQALHRLITITGDFFYFPPDFIDNVLSLAKYSDLLVEKVLLSPAATAKATLSETAAAEQIIKNAKKYWDRYKSINPEETPKNVHILIRQFDEMRLKMSADFESLKEAIVANQPDVVRQLATLIAEQHTGLMALAAKIDNAPPI